MEESLELTSGAFHELGNINSYGDPERVQELVNGRQAKATSLILVTHLEIGQSFPSHFLRTQLDIDEYVPEIAKGTAIHINLEAKAFTMLR